MGTTKIEWTATKHTDGSVTPGATWTPIRARVRKDASEIAKAKGYTSLVQIAAKQAGHVGAQCERCSEGCDNCYSETFQSRCLPHNGTGLPFDRRSRDLVEYFLDEEVLLQPLKWRKPRKIFVCSQTDLFGEWVPDEWIDRILAVMALTPHGTYQVLTKRADRMERYFADGYISKRLQVRAGETYRDARLMSSAPIPRLPYPNVHLGVSVENQGQRKRIDHLRRTPAVIRFLSCEPLLEDLCELDLTGIHWVIVGGESGPGARPMHPDWVRSLRDQCQEAGVPFFFKQWGACSPISRTDGIHELPFGEYNTFNKWGFLRKGKKAAGRLLDGREWNEFPEAK